MLAAIVCLALAQAAPLPSGDGYVADVREPTVLVIIPYDDQTRLRLTNELNKGKKVQVPTFTVRLEGLIPPGRKSPVYKKALAFAKEAWSIPKGGFTLRQMVELSYPGPTICAYSVHKRNGEWLGHVEYYRSEPSVDFQFRTWTESFDAMLIANGFVRLAKPIGDPDSTWQNWMRLEAQAKAKKLGIWAGK